MLRGVDAPLQSKLGQPSWRLKNSHVDAWIAQTGGMLAPATFRLGDGRTVQPFAVAPWARENLAPGTPPLLQALRGDFFCAPFGGNSASWRGERHPPHGESANAPWTLFASTRNRDTTELRLRLECKIRRGTIEKRVALRRGHNAIYCEHVLTGFRGPMSLGTHPCLHVPGAEDAARVSVGGWEWGQVLPVPFEDPASGGYSSLKAGARFESLTAVPLANGGVADLSRYPARSGFEDLVMLMGKPERSLGWSALTFPKERWVFLQLKNPEVLPHTVLWHSNGGRHYPPWNGRHRRVIGIEETTSYFHLGLAESARRNAVSDEGFPTAVALSRRKPLRVAHIFVVAAIPRGFDVVADVLVGTGGVTLIAGNGLTATAAVDHEFLHAAR